MLIPSYDYSNISSISLVNHRTFPAVLHAPQTCSQRTMCTIEAMKPYLDQVSGFAEVVHQPIWYMVCIQDFVVDRPVMKLCLYMC